MSGCRRHLSPGTAGQWLRDLSWTRAQFRYTLTSLGIVQRQRQICVLPPGSHREQGFVSPNPDIPMVCLRGGFLRWGVPGLLMMARTVSGWTAWLHEGLALIQVA